MNYLILLLTGIYILIVYLILFYISNNVKKCIEYCKNIPTTDFSEAVSIIKPSKGSDEFSLTNFNSWVNQKYDAHIECIFSFDEKDDAGIKIAQAVPFPNKKILINPIIEGFTGKMSALKHGLNNSNYEVVVFSDSDTKAQSDTLSKIMSQLKRGAKIVTCLAIYNQTKNIWSRLYASTWNLAEIGIVGSSILKHGDQAVGNTLALSKNTLEQLGGLDKYSNYIAEDIAIGKSAHEVHFSILLGPMIESPVGEMSFHNLIEKYSRAASYAITMRGLKNNWQFIVIYSYFLVFFPPAIFLSANIVILAIFLALGRLTFASYLWFMMTGEKKVFIECFLGDILFFFMYIRSLIFKTMSWSSIKYRVDSTGRLTILHYGKLQS